MENTSLEPFVSLKQDGGTRTIKFYSRTCAVDALNYTALFACASTNSTHLVLKISIYSMLLQQILLSSGVFSLHT